MILRHNFWKRNIVFYADNQQAVLYVSRESLQLVQDALQEIEEVTRVFGLETLHDDGKKTMTYPLTGKK